MNRESEQLLARYLSGEDVADELLLACREKPDVLATLAEQVALDRLLAFRTESEDDAIFVMEVRERLAHKPSNSFADGVTKKLERRKANWFFSPLVKIAAAALILLGVGAAVLVSRQPTAVATLERVSGEVFLGEDSKINLAKTGTSFPSGSEVFCPPGMNDAVVRCRDGSRFRLTSGTRITFSIVDGQYVLNLSEGFLEADVQKQPAGLPLVISTPSAKITVLGTRLKLSATSDSTGKSLSSKLVGSTTLTVDEGAVEIKKPGGEIALVETGKSTFAVAEHAMEVVRINTLEVDRLAIISASFGARSSWIDVTQQLQSRANDSRLVTVGAFRHLGGDPLPGVAKTLKIEYEIDGKTGSAEFNEVRSHEGTLRSDFILPVLLARGDEAAEVLQTKISSRNELAYAEEASKTDLLHGLPAVTRGWNRGNEAEPNSLNDGIHGDTYHIESASSVAWTTTGTAGASATWDLGLGSNGYGWDITSIQTIAAWVNAGFGNQAYIVEIKRQGARDFTVLATVDHQPLPYGVSGPQKIDPGATRVTLAGADHGVLASGVEYIRFTANRVNGGTYGGAFTFREVDVFGSETQAPLGATGKTLNGQSERQ